MIRRPPRSTRTDTLFPYTTLFRSPGQTDQVGPVFPNQIDFDPAPGNLIELSVARLAVDAPQLRAADVRQTGAESVAQEPEQAENCVGIRSEERRVGKECVRPFRSRWAPDH